MSKSKRLINDKDINKVLLIEESRIKRKDSQSFLFSGSTDGLCEKIDLEEYDSRERRKNWNFSLGSSSI